MEDTICGRGNSIVQKAMQRGTNKPVAIKLVEAGHLVETTREAAALEMLRHENIVRLLDVFASRSNGTKLVFELWGKDLGKRIASAPSLSSGEIRTLTKQIFSAVAYVHDMGLCHNDIKPKNMLVQGDLLKLCDFGIAYQLGRRVCECSENVARYGLQQQTLWYRAPEVLLGDNTFGAPADIWSLAVTVLHMVTSESPWQPRGRYEAILDIFKILGTPCAADWPNVSNLVHWKENFPIFPKRSLASPFPSVPAAGVLNFVSSILVCNPGKRLTAREACQHAYLIPQPSTSGVSKTTALAQMPILTFKAPIALQTFAIEAERVGADLRSFAVEGYTVLKTQILSEAERTEALAAAMRVHQKNNRQNEFVAMRSKDVEKDKRVLFALLNKYIPFLHQLFSGIRLPGSDWSPYAHHNNIQIAIKKPGFQDYSLEEMYSARVGHIDQPHARQKPEGKKFCNYSALFGIVLDGATATRDDAGNLFVAPRTHNEFAKAFQKLDDTPAWYERMEEHYLDRVPEMIAVRAQPGQAILMQNQVIHAVGPNHSDQDRVHIYFRITAADRPRGSLISYREAMLDTTYEAPLLKQWQQQQEHSATQSQ